jgi:hypothetical protein
LKSGSPRFSIDRHLDHVYVLTVKHNRVVDPTLLRKPSRCEAAYRPLVSAVGGQLNRPGTEPGKPVLLQQPDNLSAQPSVPVATVAYIDAKLEYRSRICRFRQRAVADVLAVNFYTELSGGFGLAAKEASNDIYVILRRMEVQPRQFPIGGELTLTDDIGTSNRTQEHALAS